MKETAPNAASMSHQVRRNGPGGAIAHPLILICLCVWVLNDHLFKEMFGNTWTGKLSDVASLAVFPRLPYCTYEVVWAWMGRPVRHRRRVLWVSIIATGSVMVGINVSDVWAQSYELGLGLAQWPFRWLYAWFMGQTSPVFASVELTMDPTDIWTLPALAIPWWVARTTLGAPGGSGASSPD